MLTFFIGFILFEICRLSVYCADWSYDESSTNGPSNWGRIYTECSGKRQSPININQFSAVPVLLGPRVTIQDIDKRPTSINYTNDGHGASISFNFEDGIQPRVSGGPLRGDSYILHNLHMHWRSEHTFNHHHFDGELHMVHYNSKYNSLANALSQSDGVAVLGFLLYIPAITMIARFDRLRPLIRATENIREPRSTYEEKTNLFSLFDILGTRFFTVYNYNGSLTTPRCNEVVTWMVNKVLLPITPSELQALRLIKDEDGNVLYRNNRPPQNLNGRSIFCY